MREYLDQVGHDYGEGLISIFIEVERATQNVGTLVFMG